MVDSLTQEFIYFNNPNYNQIALSNGNILEFYYDVKSSSKNLVASLKILNGSNIETNILISSTNNNDVVNVSLFLRFYLMKHHQLYHGFMLMILELYHLLISVLMNLEM